MVLIGVAIVGFVGLIIFSGGGGDSTPQENTEETVQQGAEDTEDENGESPEETSETGETTETSGNNEGDENQDAEESGNENRTGDSNSSSDQQEQGDNESEQTGSPDDERSEKLANGHLKHDESVKNEFIETFQNAESMGSSELETALADFAEKYDRETLIPALIEAYREADAWVAAQANELLEKIAHKNTSDPRGLSEEGRMTNYEDLKSWWIYTDIDSLIARIERREKLNRQQEELIPLLKDYVSNISQTRWNAENKLRQMGKDYIPAMIDLIDNSRQMAAAQGAHKFLNDITSNNLGEFPTAADKRDELKRNWQEWWENNRNEVQIQE